MLPLLPFSYILAGFLPRLIGFSFIFWDFQQNLNLIFYRFSGSLTINKENCYYANPVQALDIIQKVIDSQVICSGVSGTVSVLMIRENVYGLNGEY